MPNRTLPDYENPPVQETWMAFGFVPLPWSIPHFGAFWDVIRADYPRPEVHPPVGEFKIEFNALGSDLPVRCWFVNDSSNRLIQVQRNRFVHNWRRPNPLAEYLPYDELRPVFVRQWARFCDFAKSHEMEAPNVQSCEVSYINHLDRGIGWGNFSDLAEIFPSVGSLQGRTFVPKPESVVINGSYVMSPNEGRLRIGIQPAIRQADGKEIIQLTITGSCRPSSNETAQLLQCLDDCRDWVVRGFDDFTSPHMHKIWGEK